MTGCVRFFALESGATSGSFPVSPLRALPSRWGLQMWAKRVGRRPLLLVEPDAGALRFAASVYGLFCRSATSPHRDKLDTLLSSISERTLREELSDCFSPRNPADIVSQPAIVLTDRKGRRVDPAPDQHGTALVR